MGMRKVCELNHSFGAEKVRVPRTDSRQKFSQVRSRRNRRTAIITGESYWVSGAGLQVFQSHKDQGTTREIKGETYATRWTGFGLLRVRGQPYSWSSKPRSEQKQKSGCLEFDSLSCDLKVPEISRDQGQNLFQVGKEDELNLREQLKCHQL